jgi:hypothetical protein
MTEHVREINEVFAGMTAALAPVIDDLAAAEAAARYWYRRLVGDPIPLPPEDKYRMERDRRLLRRIYSNDPEKAERELLDWCSDSHRQAVEYCWGPDHIFLKEVMSARCGVTPRQLDGMTWWEIAAEPKAACERKPPPPRCRCASGGASGRPPTSAWSRVRNPGSSTSSAKRKSSPT